MTRTFNMDFLTLFAGLADITNVFQIVCLAVFVWLIIVYLPKRDEDYTNRLDTIVQQFTAQLAQHDEKFQDVLQQIQRDERDSHLRILEQLSDHDKHSMNANSKINDIHEKILK